MYKSGANTVYVNTWTPYMGTKKIYSVNGDWYIDLTGKAYLHGVDINGNDFLTQHKDNPKSSSDPDNLGTRTIKITDAIADAGFGTGDFNLDDLTFAPQKITKQTGTTHISFIESDDEDKNTVFVVGKTVQGILKIEANGQPITKNISMTAKGVYDNGRNSVVALNTNSDGTPQVFYESIEGGGTDYTKLWIRLENNNAIHNIDVSGAYNAGVTAAGSSFNISNLTFTPQDITESQTIDIQFTKVNKKVYADGKIVQGILKIEAGGQSIIKNISMSAIDVYNKGWDEGLTSASVGQLSVAKKQKENPDDQEYYPNTIGGVKRWLIPVTIFGRVNGTKSDNTSYQSQQYTSSDQSVLDFTTIYNDIIENSGGSRTITGLSWTESGSYDNVDATFDKGEPQTNIPLPKVENKTLYQFAYGNGYGIGRNSVDALKTNDDGTPQVFYESIEGGSTDYTKLWIRLENENAIHNIDVSGAYNAGVSAGGSLNISELAFTSVSNFSQDSVYVSSADAASSGTSSYTSTVTANLKVNDTKIFENVPVNITEITNKLSLRRSSVSINPYRGKNGYEEIDNKKYLYLLSNYELRFDSTRIVDWYDRSQQNRINISNYVNGISISDVTYGDYSDSTYNYGPIELDSSHSHYDSNSDKVQGRIKIKFSDDSEKYAFVKMSAAGKSSGSSSGDIDLDDIAIYKLTPIHYTSASTKDPVYVGTANTQYLAASGNKSARIQGGVNVIITDGSTTKQLPIIVEMSAANAPGGSSSTLTHSIIKDPNNWTDTSKQYNFTINNKKAENIRIYMENSKVYAEYNGGNGSSINDTLFTISTSNYWSIFESNVEFFDAQSDDFKDSITITKANTEYNSNNDYFSVVVKTTHNGASKWFKIDVPGSKKTSSSSGGTEYRVVTGSTYVAGSTYTKLNLTYNTGATQEITLPLVWNSYTQDNDSAYGLGYSTGYNAAGGSGGGYTSDDINNARAQGQREMYRYYKMDLIWNYNGYVTQITAYDIDGNYIKSFNAREGDIFR